MPQLYSRMDDISWLTPPIADILDQGASPPGGNGLIREQMLTLQSRLSELETPARVVNVRPTPSYTLFIAKPDMIGELGKRRPVTVNEIKRSLAHIAEEKKEWKLGFIPQLQEVSDAVGILLRTEEHRPLSLRRFLVRGTYRDHPSTMAVALGNTLEQQLCVYDLATLGGLLMVGPDLARQHFINSILLTLLSVNTPGELRVAIASQNSEAFRSLVHIPHALGRVLSVQAEARRLLEGLVKEVQRRREWFSDKAVDTLDNYNEILKAEGGTRIPRILFLIDSFSNNEWLADRSEWIPHIAEILNDTGKSGVHLLLTASQSSEPDLPAEIADIIPIAVAARSVAGQYTSKLESFHGSLMRFIDAVIIDNREKTITPVEQCTISTTEIENLVSYWKRVTDQRSEETRLTQVSGTTGVTGMLQRPDTPTNTQKTGPLSPPDEPSTGVKTVNMTEVNTDMQTDKSAVEQAQALAAYLGWLSIGALQDILGMSVNDAQKTMLVLKAMGIIEDNSSTVARFIRLTTISPKE